MVEKVDAKLAHIEENWAKSQSEPFPEGVQNAIVALRASLEEEDTEKTRTSELSDLVIDV
jgi:non-homologous end joining protein Ku